MLNYPFFIFAFAAHCRGQLRRPQRWGPCDLGRFRLLRRAPGVVLEMVTRSGAKALGGARCFWGSFCECRVWFIVEKRLRVKFTIILFYTYVWIIFVCITYIYLRVQLAIIIGITMVSSPPQVRRWPPYLRFWTSYSGIYYYQSWGHYVDWRNY